MTKQKTKLNPKLSEIYESLLSKLDLQANHKSQMNARGMSSDFVERMGYKSLPNNRAGVASAIAKEFDNDLSGIPGFWLPDDKGINARWQLAGASGLLIPVRDHKGEVVQIKIRPDKTIDGGAKYISLSSAKYPNGASAQANVHWPKADIITPTIRITEGEIKADIATHQSGIYTISCPGVNSWRVAADAVLELNPDEIWVCFDSDKDGTRNLYNGDAEEVESNKPNDVGKYAGKLARYLDSNHPNVKIETWNPELGKGIDDVLMDGGETSLMTQEEKSQFIEEKLEGLVQFGWFYSMGSGMMHNYDDFSDPTASKRENWNNFFMCEENTKPFEHFMLDPSSLKVHDITYEPKQPQLMATKKKKLFNSWAPSEIKPQAGDVEPLLNHMRVLLPNNNEHIILERFFAWMIAREGEKLAWAILIQGDQGIGKSWFAELLKGCLGEWNVSMPDNAEITSDYTNWAKEVSAIVIDEFDAGRADNKRKVMDTLKPMITGNRVRIREMYRNHYSMPNCFNIIAFTNHKDAIYVESGDRRYYYVEAQDTRLKNPRHMIELWDWLRDPQTVPAVLYWAHNYDHSWLEEFGQMPAPVTTAKERITAENRHPVDQWVEEGVQTCQHPFNRDVVCTSFLMRFVPFWVKGSNVTNLGRALAKVEGVTKEPREIPFGSGKSKKRSVYYLRDAEKYLALKPRDISSALTGDEPMLSNETAQEYTDRIVEAMGQEKPDNPHFDDEPI